MTTDAPSSFDDTREYAKFSDRRDAYRRGIETITTMGYSPADLILHGPAFAGHMTIARFLALYEAYKMTAGVAGHLAELGVYRGSGLLFFAKLIQLFEPWSGTLAHGFDWFKGSSPAPEDIGVSAGMYQEDQARLRKLIEVQGLANIAHLHDVDLSKDLPGFFERYPTMIFKLVFFDCGTYPVARPSIEHFWSRLTPGGIMVFDQLNHEHAPGEARAVREVLGDIPIKTFPFCWLPSAYAIKT